jgi:hypothetical protein
VEIDRAGQFYIEGHTVATAYNLLASQEILKIWIKKISELYNLTEYIRIVGDFNTEA